MNMAVSAAGHQSSFMPPAGVNAHTVERGDTLWDIAMRNGISLQALIEANPQILNPDLIYPGDQVVLPEGSSGGPPGAPGGSGGPGGPAESFGPAPVGNTAPLAPGEGVSARQLMQIVPQMDPGQAPAIAGHLNQAMAEAGITSRQEQAMFIAQLAHESGGFRYMEEIASGAAYEGRSDLGNTRPGDGVRYKGRGFIQITGRHNYTEAGRALGLDLVNNPGLASRPENAAWYWNSRNISAAASNGDFIQVTRLINGGTNGLADRQSYYARARAALGA